jgi:hypothetical protein
MKKLSKDEMKMVIGGQEAPFPGGCCVHTSSWNGYQCGLNSGGAQGLFDNGNGGWDNWCCDSCVASWYTQYA